MSSKAALAAVLLTTVGVARSADAFEVKHTTEGRPVRWTRSSVAFSIDRSVRAVPGGEAAVTAAVAAWTQKGGAPALKVAATGAKLKPGFDGTSAVFYAPDGFEAAGKALAVTLVEFDERTGDVLEADIVLNGRYKLGRVDATAGQRSSDAEDDDAPYDVVRVVAHEMGHALALSDELSNEDALMNPFVGRGRLLRATPDADDIAGLSALYAPAAAAELASEATDAKNEASSGCGGSTVARGGTGAAPATALVAVGLLLAAVVVGRSERRGRAAVAGAAVLAACALVVLPPARSGAAKTAGHARAVVTRVHTTDSGGVFRSELELETTSCRAGECPEAHRAVVWGGTLYGVKQVVGGVDVPRAGAHVEVVFDGSGHGMSALVRDVESGSGR